MDKENKKLISVFFSLGRMMRSRCHANYLSGGLSLLKMEILQQIKEVRPTMKDLAKHLSVTAPTTTKLVANLVDNGLVERYIDPSDRRFVRLSLTTKGEKLIINSERFFESQLSSLFACLTSGEKKILSKILEKITKQS
jgi:DNA-binding MarR family transcriptional regulator